MILALAYAAVYSRSWKTQSMVDVRMLVASLALFMDAVMPSLYLPRYWTYLATFTAFLTHTLSIILLIQANYLL